MSIIDKFKDFGKSFVFYFTHVDAVKIVSWVQYVFCLVVTIVMTRFSLYWYYNPSVNYKLTYAEYVEANKSLMVSFGICAVITWLFFTALIAWAIGKLVKTKFNFK